jgi:hypothetical protein
MKLDVILKFGAIAAAIWATIFCAPYLLTGSLNFGAGSRLIGPDDVHGGHGAS